MDSNGRSNSLIESRSASEQPPSLLAVDLPHLPRAHPSDDARDEVYWDQLREYCTDIKPILEQWRAENEAWAYHTAQRLNPSEEIYQALPLSDEQKSKVAQSLQSMERRMEALEAFISSDEQHKQENKARFVQEYETMRQEFERDEELMDTEDDQDDQDDSSFEQEYESRIQDLMGRLAEKSMWGQCEEFLRSIRQPTEEDRNSDSFEEQRQACIRDLKQEWKDDDTARFLSFWREKIPALWKSGDTDSIRPCFSRKGYWKELYDFLDSGKLPQITDKELIYLELLSDVNKRAFERLFNEKFIETSTAFFGTKKREGGLPPDQQSAHDEVDTLEPSEQPPKKDRDSRVPGSE